MEASRLPTRVPPIHRNALRRESLPSASSLASSSKEVWPRGAGRESPPLLQLSLSIRPAPFPRHATLRSTRLHGSVEGVRPRIWTKWPPHARRGCLPTGRLKLMDRARNRAACHQAGGKNPTSSGKELTPLRYTALEGSTDGSFGPFFP